MSDYFHKISNQKTEKTKRLKKNTKKTYRENIPHSLTKRKLRGKIEKKFPNQSYDAMQLLYTSQITEVAVRNYCTE